MFLQFPILEGYYRSDATGERPKQLEQAGLLIMLSVYLASYSLYKVLDMSYTVLQSSLISSTFYPLRNTSHGLSFSDAQRSAESDQTHTRGLKRSPRDSEARLEVKA